ncbi:MAG: FkbM family methyltransferase [Rhodospirillaceae bacterium]
MSRTIARSLCGVVDFATSWMKPYRRTNTRSLVSEGLSQTISVDSPGGPLHFYGSSARSLHDPLALLTGEPETIAWIDGLQPGETLWDIGANVGTYAVYAAKVQSLRVLAFEPSASTYAVLVRNVELNGLDASLDAYCIAFDARTRLDRLHMAHTEAGHSMHAFGQAQTVEGTLDAVFRQSVPGFSIDDFMRIFDPPPPDHIKLDVDSIEESILHGAADTLKRHVRSVLVEIADAAPPESGGGAAPGAGIRRALADRGFAEVKDFCATARRNVLFRRSG